MNETGNSLLASGTSTINGYSGCTISSGKSTFINGGTAIVDPNNYTTNINSYSTGITISNSNNMRTKQVKAAVFTIERNDKNEVVSSKFVKELWVEIKNGASLDLVVAKELKGDFDPETTVIKEITTVSF